MSIVKLPPKTPAIVFNELKIIKTTLFLLKIASESNCSLLYSLKPSSFKKIISYLADKIDGLSTSSLFEAKLAKEVLKSKGTIHFTSPGIIPEDIEQIISLCDYLIFNSITQWNRYKQLAINNTNCGLRINPQIQFVNDDRYNPSRKASKLGVPINQLVSLLVNDNKKELEGISGIHFHNNCESTNFNHLLQTIEKLDLLLARLIKKIKWINLGGGYLFQHAKNLEPFYKAINLLNSKYDLKIFIEPGTSIVRDAGYIVSSVLDIFNSDDKTIAVLDTTINHMPEVFEYQYEPDVVGHTETGKYRYLLAGASCLAGDLFGEYAFNEPLQIGSRIVFSGMGAYTLVKANMFNGINLPTIYSVQEDGKLVMLKEFSYADFASRCGVNEYETL